MAQLTAYNSVLQIHRVFLVHLFLTCHAGHDKFWWSRLRITSI